MRYKLHTVRRTPLAGKQIVVVTPEKLLYVLRHNPELADSIGLVIYDEGHQFDSGNRGVTYELLITSLKALIPKSAQTVLISAVISNAESISGWLNGGDGVVVTGVNMLPTYRSLAFTSWQSSLGRLEFVDPIRPDQQEFFVPRVLETLPLGRLKGERKDRTFPDKGDGFDIAVYLGVKLVSQGSVAIFCGRKDTASNIAATAANIFDRGIGLPQPLESANRDEVKKLANLYEAHLGIDAEAARASKVGVFTHHGNTPHGLRLSVEHAMKEGLASFVVCTSTLAQGVNLPIRYLIITGTYQGQDQIKTRDFHNLMGRAGRAGMHTEGSVLFSDPSLFDERKSDGKFRWSGVINLLDPTNSEPCASSLLSVFSPYVSEDGRTTIIMEPLTFATAYIENFDDLMRQSREIATKHSGSGFTEAGVLAQAELKARAIAAVESHLMAFWEDESDMPDEAVASLARGTLAYYLADEKEKELLIKLFLMLAKNIRENVTTPQLRQIFSRILFGVYESQLIQTWVQENEEAIGRSTTTVELLEVLWPVIARSIRNSTFTKLNPDSVQLPLAKQWIKGESFESMFATITKNNVRLGHGKKPRKPKVDHAVDVGENAFAYDGMLVIGAVRELFELKHPADSTPIELLAFLQRQMKYGLGSLTSVLLFEIGFADRIVAQKLEGVVDAAPSRRRLVRRMRENSAPVREALAEFPAYFTSVLDSLIG